jgi:hypothetical protein
LVETGTVDRVGGTHVVEGGGTLGVVGVNGGAGGGTTTTCGGFAVGVGTTTTSGGFAVGVGGGSGAWGVVVVVVVVVVTVVLVVTVTELFPTFFCQPGGSFSFFCSPGGKPSRSGGAARREPKLTDPSKSARDPTVMNLAIKFMVDHRNSTLGPLEFESSLVA